MHLLNNAPFIVCHSIFSTLFYARNISLVIMTHFFSLGGLFLAKFREIKLKQSSYTFRPGKKTVLFLELY